MGPKLKILDVVLRRLKERKSPFLGELYGVLHDNTLIVLSFTLRYVDDQNDSKYQVTENNFPTEVDICGVVSCKQNSPVFDAGFPQDVKTVLEDVVVTDNPVLLSYGYLEKENAIKAFFDKNDAATSASFDIITQEELWKQFIVIHLSIPIMISCNNRSHDKEEFFTEFNKKITSGAAMFQLNDSNIYLTSNDAEGMSQGEDVTDLLLGHDPESKRLSETMIKIASDRCHEPCIVRANMLMKTTYNKQSEKKIKKTLSIHQTTKDCEIIQGYLKLSSLIMFQKNRSEKHLYNALIDSICRVMKLTKRSFFINDSVLPEIYHFFTSHLGHFTTFVFPSNMNDQDLIDSRKYVHCKFNLPCDRPLFRRVNSYKFDSIKLENRQQLMNVHNGLSSSGVNGEVSVVQGDYLYFHYMHNNFNDNGWGCAYRSLQTLFSWYQLQGWTDREVPSIPEIQQTLVDIRDKPKSFVGSRQWIGSMEVTFVLDTLLNVTCRVLNVQKGESVADHVHELFNHFRKHGTPVMIGGGVLAHTILGVEINEETDEARFLVLDPHYAGSDQLTQIQNKGWVGWKKAEFWKSDAFYNLCLPYRKIGV